MKRKITTAKSKYSISGCVQLEGSVPSRCCRYSTDGKIPPELILQLGSDKIMPSNTWTMDKQGSKRVEVVGVDDKHLIPAVICSSLVGDFLPVQVIYQGKAMRCHPRYEFPSDWGITHTPKHWSNEETMVRYVKSVIIPYVRHTWEGGGGGRL